MFSYSSELKRLVVEQPAGVTAVERNMSSPEERRETLDALRRYDSGHQSVANARPYRIAMNGATWLIARGTSPSLDATYQGMFDVCERFVASSMELMRLQPERR